MTIPQAIILGFIEGITEFLPISSTAHLLVAERIMGNVEPSLFFNTVIQMGALGAVIIYFRRRLIVIIENTVEYLRELSLGKAQISPSSLPTGLNILVATLPVFVVGFIARKQIAELHNSMTLIAASSIVVAILLWYGQRIAKRDPKAKVGARELLTMGMYQILAIIPGVSRSGIVMVGGLMQELSFEKVLEYSFLMSIPALGGAGLFELLSIIEQRPSSEILFSTLIATGVAFVSALLAIKFLLALVRRMGFTPFVLYRFGFGIVALFFR